MLQNFQLCWLSGSLDTFCFLSQSVVNKRNRIFEVHFNFTETSCSYESLVKFQLSLFMPIVKVPLSDSIFCDDQSHTCTFNVERLKVLIFKWSKQCFARLMMYTNFCGRKSQPTIVHRPVDGSKSETACNTSDFPKFLSLLWPCSSSP